MSTSRTTEIIRSILFVCLFACLLLITSPVCADDCAGAAPIDLGTSLRAYADLGEPLLVTLEVPSAGILSLDAAVPGLAAPEPRLKRARACMPRSVPEPRLLERAAGHLVMAVEVPGTYLFRITAQDPLQPLGELKVSSAFVADSSFGGIPTRDGEDEEEIEIDATPFAGGKPDVSPGSWDFDKDGEDEEEIEIDAMPLQGPGTGTGRSLHAILGELCRSGEVDDHGDSFTCASYLSPGRVIAGELENGWGDDADVFELVLGGSAADEPWTVEIEAAGDAESVGGLYDGSGQRLATADAGGLGGGFRIVRTLAPGVYYLRVESRDGAGGFYALSFDASR